MRILCLSNFYPPAGRGGYEQWCQEVTEGLRERGHEVVVLTSRHGREALSAPGPAWIYRDLHLEMELASLRNSVSFFTSRHAHENANLTCLRDLLEGHAPEIVLVWGMWNLSTALPALAEELLPGRVVYYMGDYWPTLPSQLEVYWQVPARSGVTTLPKTLLRPLAQRMLRIQERPDLDFAYVMFPTAFLRDELARKGFKPKWSKLIYGAIDTRSYVSEEKRPKRGEVPLTTLLYVGRLTEEKGPHTAIEALSLLIYEQGLDGLRLTLVGSGEPEYETYLRRLSQEKQVEGVVTFLPSQPKETMPDLYRQADIVLFTSIWPEPFGRVPVEAMASGTVVVGSATGGAAEVLVNGENALTFTPDDPTSLAAQVARLVRSPELADRLAATGQETATRCYDLERMTAEIEMVLRTILDGTA